MIKAKYYVCHMYKMGCKLIDENNYQLAIIKLKELIPKIQIYDTDQIIESKDEVIKRYGAIFSLENIDNISKEDFQSFLLFKNNHHWNGLHRQGSQICLDMSLLRKSLRHLIDESRPIDKRIDHITYEEHVQGLGKAIFSAILLVSNPEKYSVWNNPSESGLRKLNIWPRFDQGTTLGKRYEIINQLQNRLSRDLNIDLWTLDTLWWIKGIIDNNMRKVWWVNQSKNLDFEISRGYLWAPNKSKDGKVLSHWSVLKDVNIDDIIVHYANGSLRYVSIVIDEPSPLKRPDAVNYEEWEDEGWQVKFEHFELNPHIPLSKFNNQLSKLKIDQGPLDVKLEVKQGYMFRFSEEALGLIQNLQPETKWPDYAIINYHTGELPVNEKYSIEDFCKDTGFTHETIQSWERRLKRKKQIIFQGPPGTGKTFVSQKLAKLLISDTDGICDLVQFHPSYAYEDFILGIRPKTENGQISYNLEEGRFLEFCKKAGEVPTSPCVLIIDEINRANLSRVFGELMYLLEYRENEIPLSGGRKFKIPENVYIIGTMNTADRSIALVDHALRRRFSFIRLNPEYDVLKKYLTERGYPVNSIVYVLEDVNKAIDDPNYMIGISYFMKKDDNLVSSLPEIWMSEIEPYLEEFFYDQPENANQFRWNELSKNKLSDWVKPQ